MMNTKLLFVCGTTGGHVYPAIAIAQVWKGDSMFICSDSKIDKSLIESGGMKYKTIQALKKWNIASVIKAFLEAKKILEEENPKAVIASGSGFTVPVILAAKFLKIPYILLEQNTIPGRVTRIFAKGAQKVYLSFDESKAFFNSKNVEVSGNPIRLSGTLEKGIKNELQTKTGKWVLVIGGSQGAKALNDQVESEKEALLKQGYNVFHLTGKEKYAYTEKLHIEVHNSGRKYCACAYLDQVTALYPYMNYVIGRAGATTIAELKYYQKKAVLVPYPYAKDNHQKRNAEVLSSEGQAILIEEKKLTKNSFQEALNSLAKQPIKEISTKNPVYALVENLEHMLN